MEIEIISHLTSIVRLILKIVLDFDPGQEMINQAKSKIDPQGFNSSSKGEQKIVTNCIQDRNM